MRDINRLTSLQTPDARKKNATAMLLQTQGALADLSALSHAMQNEKEVGAFEKTAKAMEELIEQQRQQIQNHLNEIK